MTYPYLTPGRILLLFVFALLLGAASLHAAQDGTDPPPGALAGKIIDATDQPAAGATVWLFGGSYEDLKNLEKTTTDAQGRFVFNDAKTKYSNLPHGSLPHVFVESIEGQIGWNRNLWSHPQNLPLRNVRIQLVKTQAFRGRLVDSSGHPVAKASIRPRTLEMQEPGQRYSDTAPLCPDMIDKCRGETDADGSFTLGSMPLEGKVTAEITAPGIGAFRAEWDLQKPLMLPLVQPGKIEGKFDAPSAIESLADIKIYLSTRSTRESTKDQSYHLFPLNYETTPDKDGRFEFASVPPGKYNIHPSFTESTAPYNANPTADFEVKAGETTKISIPLSSAIEIRGQVVDQETGKGIQGVRVISQKIDEKTGYSVPGRFTTTDPEGNYRLFTEAGKVIVRVFDPPEDYVIPDSDKTDQLEVKEPIHYPTLKLQKAVRMEGVVVDESGKPMPGAEIQMLLPKSPCDHLIETVDENGRFVIKKLAPQKTFSLRARSQNAISKTMDIVPAKVPEPLRVELSKKLGFAVKGRCVDESGKPIYEAKVGLSSAWMLGPTGIGTTDGSNSTDADGRFEVGLLWPGSNYTLQINAEGYARYESPRIKSVPGETHDFGEIVLQSQSGFIEGTVVDTAGKPLVDVHVFHHRGAVQPLTAVTNASGEFRIMGLRSGSDYVFAEKEGYRLKSAYLPANTKGAKIVLIRRDEPAPPWKPERQPTSFAEEQAVAHKLLDKLYQVPNRGPNSWSYRFIARFDPASALQWSGKMGGRFDSTVREMVAEQLVETDFEETIALLNPVTDYSTFSTLLTLADRYSQVDAEKANRLLAEAILLARKLDQPDRTQALAKAGSMAGLLGQAEAGRKIIEEAAEAAAKMGGTDRNAWVRYQVAGALAPYNLSQALSLVEPIAEKNTRDDGLAAIATGLANKDLDKALEILSKVDKRSTLADNTRLKIAYHLAPDRLQDALRVVESMDTHGAKKIGAEAYIRLGERIFPSNPQMAWSLLEKSMAIYENNASEMGSWLYYGDRGTFAAFLVAQAARQGCPETGEFIDQALAMRPTDDDGSRTRETQKNVVAMAKYLALVDPATAKHLLESVSPRCESLTEFGFPGIESHGWSQAWALADLPQLTAMLERRLDAATKDPEVNLDNCGLDEILELLTTPSEKRIPVLDRRTRSFLSPEDDN